MGSGAPPPPSGQMGEWGFGYSCMLITNVAGATRGAPRSVRDGAEVVQRQQPVDEDGPAPDRARQCRHGDAVSDNSGTRLRKNPPLVSSGVSGARPGTRCWRACVVQGHQPFNLGRCWCTALPEDRIPRCRWPLPAFQGCPHGLPGAPQCCGDLIQSLPRRAALENGVDVGDRPAPPPAIRDVVSCDGQPADMFPRDAVRARDLLPGLPCGIPGRRIGRDGIPLARRQASSLPGHAPSIPLSRPTSSSAPRHQGVDVWGATSMSRRRAHRG